MNEMLSSALSVTMAAALLLKATAAVAALAIIARVGHKSWSFKTVRFDIALKHFACFGYLASLVVQPGPVEYRVTDIFGVFFCGLYVWTHRDEWRGAVPPWARRQSAVRQRGSGHAATLLTVLVLGLVLAAGVLRGPAIEASASPVLNERHDLEQIRRDGDALLVEIVVEKLRPCSFAGQRYLIGSDTRGWRDAPFSRPGTREGASRPVGLQSFGWYRFDVREALDGDAVRGVIWYDCHPLWQVPADLGPWIVGPVKQ